MELKKVVMLSLLALFDLVGLKAITINDIKGSFRDPGASRCFQLKYDPNTQIMQGYCQIYDGVETVKGDIGTVVGHFRKYKPKLNRSQLKVTPQDVLTQKYVFVDNNGNLQFRTSASGVEEGLFTLYIRNDANYPIYCYSQSTPYNSRPHIKPGKSLDFKIKVLQDIVEKPFIQCCPVNNSNKCSYVQDIIANTTLAFTPGPNGNILKDLLFKSGNEIAKTYGIKGSFVTSCPLMVYNEKAEILAGKCYNGIGYLSDSSLKVTKKDIANKKLVGNDDSNLKFYD